MKPSIVVASLLILCLGCTGEQREQLAQHEKDQIKNDLNGICDSLIARWEGLDGEGALQYYLDTPDWVMFAPDGSRWSFQAFKKGNSDLRNSLTAWKWITTRRDFIFLTRDVVICAWDGSVSEVLKSGDSITYNPFAMTPVFKRIAGQWKIIYGHNSGLAVTQKVARK